MKKTTAIILFLLILIISISIFMFNKIPNIEDKETSNISENFVINTAHSNTNTILSSTNVQNNVNYENTTIVSYSENLASYGLKSPSEYKIGDHIINSSYVIGYIDIPQLDIHFPIGNNIEKDIALEVSTYLSYGNGLHELGCNTIIGGARSFSRLKELKEGDIIYITDQNNQKLPYKVIRSYLTDFTNIDHMSRGCYKGVSLSYMNLRDQENSPFIVLADLVDSDTVNE